MNTWDLIRQIGNNCTGSGLDLHEYTGRSYADLKNAALLGGPDVPEYVSGAIDLLWQGNTMYAGDHLVSYDGRFNIMMQADGNFVMYKRNVGAVWSTNTAGNPGARIVFQNDGNLVVYRTNNTVAWSSNTFGCCGWRLGMHNDGNFVIWNGGIPVWNTGPH